jgi:hypothetical protein
MRKHGTGSFLLIRLFILALLTCAAMWVSSKSAQALPSSETDITYYSDDTFTTEVGEMFHSCSGGRTMLWGVTSDYKRSFSEPCDTGGGGGYCSCTCEVCTETGTCQRLSCAACDEYNCP